jgi:hypothetical protein
MNFKIGNLFICKFVGTDPRLIKKEFTVRGLTEVENHWFRMLGITRSRVITDRRPINFRPVAVVTQICAWALLVQ